MDALRVSGAELGRKGYCVVGRIEIKIKISTKVVKRTVNLTLCATAGVVLERLAVRAGLNLFLGGDLFGGDFL